MLHCRLLDELQRKFADGELSGVDDFSLAMLCNACELSEGQCWVHGSNVVRVECVGQVKEGVLNNVGTVCYHLLTLAWGWWNKCFSIIYMICTISNTTDKLCMYVCGVRSFGGSDANMTRMLQGFVLIATIHQTCAWCKACVLSSDGHC